jgi:hypothetical protein
MVGTSFCLRHLSKWPCMVVTCAGLEVLRMLQRLTLLSDSPIAMRSPDGPPGRPPVAAALSLLIRVAPPTCRCPGRIRLSDT